MHRFRSWTLDPPEYRTQRNRLLPIEGGDGSTLNLDFTTGVLDPRLTFTRSTNATFINSSGLVQYADANMVVNADFVGAGTGNAPTAWTGSTGINLSIPATGVRRAETTTAAMNYIQSANLTTSTGLTYSTSVYVNEVSGQHYTNTLVITGSATTIGYFRNGSSVNQFATALPGLITVVWTATGTHGIRVGIGSTGSNVANAICEFTQPRTVPGNFTQPTFFANSSTTAAYHAPRFDYDPTTLAPRGLLIEGSASTLNQWSEDYTQAYWSKINASIDSTAVTCPDGVARTTVRVVDNTTSASHSIRRGITTAAGTTYTLSWFVKKGSTDTFAVQMFWSAAYNATLTVSSIDNNTQTVTSASGVNASVTRVSYPVHGWYRYSMVFTHPAAVTGTITPDFNFCPINNVGTYVGSGNHTDFFGIQLESGSGASSYIPTGASTGTRNADNCYIYDTTSSGGLSWFKTATQGTFYIEMFKRTAGTAFAGAGFGTRATAFQEFMLYQAVGNNWLSFNWGAGEYTTNYSALSSPFLIKAAVALSPSTPTTEADSTVSINGSNSALNTGPNIALPFTSDLFCIGGRGPAGGTAPSQNYAETAIRRIKFFPFAMTAAQMNALTTL